jgi:hypothetical protein
VSGVTGGSTTLGTIDASGNYTAPAVLPSPNTITIEAVETSKPSESASSGVALLNPIPQISGVTPASVNVGTFTLTINGSDFVNRATVFFGGANLSTTFVSNTQLTASEAATSAQVGSVAVTVTNPDPGATSSNGINAQVVGTISIAANVADRFLQQTKFGPTPQTIAQVQNSGLQGFLMQQFGLPVTPYPTPAQGETDLNLLQQRSLYRHSPRRINCGRK